MGLPPLLRAQAGLDFVRMPSPLVGLLLALLPLVVAGCSSNPAADDGGAVPAPPTTINLTEGVVVVQNLSYNPPRVETTSGGEIVWRFSDNGLAHTVTADDGSFDSGRRPSGEFRHTFTRPPGELGYHCEVHSGIKGTVVISG
jgi:plastocyanin